MNFHIIYDIFNDFPSIFIYFSFNFYTCGQYNENNYIAQFQYIYLNTKRKKKLQRQ